MCWVITFFWPEDQAWRKQLIVCQWVNRIQRGQLIHCPDYENWDLMSLSSVCYQQRTRFRNHTPSRHDSVGWDNNFADARHDGKDCWVLHQTCSYLGLSQFFGCLVAREGGGCLTNNNLEVLYVLCSLLEETDKGFTVVISQDQIVVADMLLSLVCHCTLTHFDVVLHLPYLVDQLFFQDWVFLVQGFFEILACFVIFGALRRHCLPSRQKRVVSWRNYIII